MGFVIFVFVLTVLFTGGPAMFREDFALGLAGTLAPFLAVVAGGGITSPSPSGRGGIARIAFGLALLAGAIFWLRAYGWELQLWGYRVSGTVEAIVGFVLGLAFGLTDRGEPGLMTTGQPSETQAES